MANGCLPLATGVLYVPGYGVSNPYAYESWVRLKIVAAEIAVPGRYLVCGTQVVFVSYLGR